MARDFERQSPQGIVPSDIDNIQGPNSYSSTTRADTDYQTRLCQKSFMKLKIF
jgi:hypothetical protein